jgi:uncharacterized protein with GYD domain
MAKYLIQVKYTAEGAKGLLKEGGTKRVQVVSEGIKKAGGKIEAFYFAFGKSDAFLIVDVPDTASILATNLLVNGSGAAVTHTTVLVTPEEIDAATKKGGTYTPPGH